MATYIAPAGSGMGDVIVCLPIILGLIQRGQTFLVARSPRQEGLTVAIEGLAGTVREPRLKEILREGVDTYINLRTHYLQTDYVWGGPDLERDFPGFHIEEILKVMAIDFGIEADWSNRKMLKHNKIDAFADTIILIPGTTVASKSWSLQSWLALCSLLTQHNLPFSIIGEPQHSKIVTELIANGMPWHQTATIQEAIDTVSSARATIAVDTGLMHISVTQGVPTVAFFQGSPVFYRKRPHCFPLFTPACAKECIQDLEDDKPNTVIEYPPEFSWFHGNFGKCLAEPGAGCMDSITPAGVFATLETALSYSQLHLSM